MPDPAHGRRLAPLTLAVAIVIVALDQLAKAWAVERLRGRAPIEVFWTLQFKYSENTGMAFGRGQGLGPVIGVVALVVIVVLLVSLGRGGGRAVQVIVGLVIGGAIGNVIDRLFRGRGWLRGAVVDFIDFQWFPIFNVADMGITVGGVALLLASWQASTRQAHAPAEPAADASSGPGDGGQAAT